MNHHGSIGFVTVYRVGSDLPGIRPAFAMRAWTVTHKHVHLAHDDISAAPTLDEARSQLRERYPDAVNIGAHMDDPDNVVETWVLPWGDDARVPPEGGPTFDPADYPYDHVREGDRQVMAHRRSTDKPPLKAALDALAAHADASPEFRDIEDAEGEGRLRGRLRRE